MICEEPSFIGSLNCFRSYGCKLAGVPMEADGMDTAALERVLQENPGARFIYTIPNFQNPSGATMIFVVPSERGLAGAEIELIGKVDREFILKKEVERIKDDYDFIIIDCPPSLNTLTVNAMTTADTVIVPIQCEYYALEGLSELMYTIQLVKERLNNELEIEGIVFTMYDARTCLSLQVVENVKENIDKKIYKSIIPRNVRLAEAPSYGQPINLYSPRSAGAEAYRALADEVIARK